jgi:hypothetical protein
MQIFDLFGDISIRGDNKVNNALNKIGSTLTNVGGKMMKFGGALTAGVTVPILGLIGKSAMLASDLGESFNVVNVTFGKNSDEVTEWSKNLLSKFGLVQLESMKYVGSMGAMMKSSGISAEASKDMAKSLVELTGDMSSFYNLEHEETWEKIRSGISGETEPLKSLGINMSVANLEAYALSEGIKKAWKEMSQAEQITLRYNYLMKVTADSQGDFARTSNSFANQTRILQGRLTEIGIVIGEKILPIINNFTHFLVEIVDKLSALPEPIQNGIIIFSLLAAAIGPVTLALGFLISTVGGIISSIGGLIGTVILITGIFVNFKDVINTVKRAISGDFSDSIKIITDKAKILIEVIKDNLTPIFVGLKETIFESSKDSSGIFSDFANIILKWAKKIIDYLYNVFDTFGLIPDKLKNANTKIQQEYINLNGNIKSNLSEILSSQFIFGENLTKENLKIYNKKIKDTEKLMEQEKELVIKEIKERSSKEIEELTKLFSESDILTSKEESKKLINLENFYKTEQNKLIENNEQIKIILEGASEQKRQLTESEIMTITKLREESQSTQLQIISNGELEQLRILEQTSNLAQEISRNEALNIITEANRTFDEVVKKAEEQMNKKIETIIQQRDGTHLISKEEAAGLIYEANTEYNGIVYFANKTREDTIDLASKKSNGTISEADREKREVTDKAEQIKKILKKIWNDIKGEIPDIVVEMMIDITKAIIDATPEIASAALEAGKKLTDSFIDGIGRDKQKSPGIGGFFKDIFSFASGTTNFPGGLTWINEKGPELVTLPQGSRIHTAAESMSIMNRTANNSSSNVYNFNVTLDAKNIRDFNNVVDFIDNIKIEAIARGSS